MSVIHPCPNDAGQTVTISSPTKPSSPEAWLDPREVAIVAPAGYVPNILNHVACTEWCSVPNTLEGWNAIAGAGVPEPEFKASKGKAEAAGVVVRETDGRFWLVAPTNAFGGYTWTFPKGRVEVGLTRQASAIKEAFEEAGLQVELEAHLLDADRSTTRTRYYLAKRVGGMPASMGWESQAVALVPLSELPKYLTNKNDQPLLEMLLSLKEE